MAGSSHEAKPAAIEREAERSGGHFRSGASARAGFIPIALDCVPVSALQGIPVYIRVRPERALADRAPGDAFRLYCGQDVPFTEARLRRLVQNRLKFLYIKISDHERFRTQAEASLEAIATDPEIAASAKSAMIYETSVELINELLTDTDLAGKTPRLEQVARSVTTLVMKNDDSFSHLFAASHHDFYTATHMVNVGTWMVSLAYAMGTRDPEELEVICQAGMLHDMGKLSVPSEILNKKGRLSEHDWAVLKNHPVAGCEYLARYQHIHPLVLTVTRQHHERLDGSGYPDALRGDQIHPMARLCAVVDSFDAMTAFRPFKHRTFTVAQALELLRAEAPARYDQDVIDAWITLVGDSELPIAAPPEPAARNRRSSDRADVNCKARVHRLVRGRSSFREQPGLAVIAHSISGSGLGFLSQYPIQPGEFVRIYLDSPEWRARPLTGQTVRCRSHSDCWHEIGVAFCDPAETPPDSVSAALGTPA